MDKQQLEQWENDIKDAIQSIDDEEPNDAKTILESIAHEMYLERIKVITSQH